MHNARTHVRIVEGCEFWTIEVNTDINHSVNAVGIVGPPFPLCVCHRFGGIRGCFVVIVLAAGRNVENFFAYLYDLNIGATSQARILSGLKSFYRYLIQEDLAEKDPCALITSPTLGRHLPEVLSVEEIQKMIDSIDLSQPTGHRNKAMIEVMYGCGLRVSELIGLQISNIYRKDGFLRIIGKGSKERLVPIGDSSLKILYQ